MKKLIATLFFLCILILNAQNNDIVKEREISTVQIKDESDPKALKILDLVEKNFSKNHPFSLDSYSFSSYHKYSADLDKDSLEIYKNYFNKRLDSLQSLHKKNIKLKDKKAIDSIENQRFEKMALESQMFLWEMAKHYQYSQKLGEKIVVLDNRISGLQNPIYELLTMRSNINTLPKEMKTENRNLYRFFLTESIVIDGRKNFVNFIRQLRYMVI